MAFANSNVNMLCKDFENISAIIHEIEKENSEYTVSNVLVV